MHVPSSGLSWSGGAVARWTSLAGKIAIAVGILGMTSGLSTLDLAVLLGIALIVVSYGVSLTPTSAPGSIDVRDDEIVVEWGSRRRVVRRRDVASAYVVERSLGDQRVPSVEIETRRGDRLAARIRDPAAARALVDMLGFGPGGRRVRIDLARPTRRLLNPLVGLIAYMVGTFAGGISSAVVGADPLGPYSSLVIFAGWVAGAALAYAFFKRLFAAPVVTIGDDAVAVRMRLRTTVIPRAELAGIEARAGGGPLVYARKSRGAVVAAAVLVDDARRDAAARISAERLLRAHQAPLRASTFARDGRDVAAWRAHLRAALDAGYREAGASVDDAAAVLASAAATPEQRIGAALALRVAGEPPERVRIAAEASVDPRVREALDAIAEGAEDAGDDRRVARALSKLR